jgi:predicted transcriptional regulator
MERKPLLVKEFMAASLVSFTPNQDVRDAIKLLIEKRISGGPVVDNRGNLVGVFSQKDCLQVALNAAYHDHWGGKVSEFMNKDVKTVDPDTKMIEVVELFRKAPYGRYPVVKDNRLVGQISRRDALRALLVAWSQWGH